MNSYATGEFRDLPHSDELTSENNPAVRRDWKLEENVAKDKRLKINLKAFNKTDYRIEKM